MLDLNQIHLSADGTQPRFRQLYQQLRDQILTGVLQAGTRLPSSRDLAKALGVSRNTVLQAFEQLLAEGFVSGKTGAGTFVQAQPSQVLQQANQPGQSQAAPGLSARGERLTQVDRGNPARVIAPLFSVGMPALDLFPWLEWRRLMNYQWQRGAQLAGYGDPQGYRPLREALATYLRDSRGVRCEADQILITAGAQQGIELVARLCLNPGDPVWMEDPGYIGALGGLRTAELTLVPRTLDNEGLCLEESDTPPGLIYLTPSHQYPTGVTLSLNRRQQLIDYARRHGCWVLEDDYDSEFRYDSRPLASLQGIEGGQNVIYVGTLSKVMFPALRLGYLVLPKSLVAPFCRYRALVDYHPPLHAQAATAAFIEEGLLASHIRKMRHCYQRRRDFLWQHLADRMGAAMPPRPQAGMHLCLPIQGDDQALALSANQHRMNIRPLSSYCLNAPDRGLLLGYAGYSEETMAAGLERLWPLLEPALKTSL
ncbi:PLP-dependent aminotransferase family protein [Pokkaliibacter sp. CJK22405]|uniref:MocR-like pyridoxine biosynthesis transcription factor PdxR n=1 Tax=Pokkaliibacter sp. CJK22405 TaxID=3384615 RepID=UPI003984EBE6